MIRIVADTTSSIPPEKALEMGVAYLPQIIIFGDESYRDDTEMDSATFLKRLRAASALPKTAAPPPALYNPIYKQMVEAGDTIVVIAPSAELSGTVRSATVAAQDFPEAKIHIIDTHTLGCGLGELIYQAVEWLKEDPNQDPDAFVARIREMNSRERVYFAVDTLEYLYKGGRIGGAQALFGSILQVKPILTLKDGRAEPVESQRTKRRAMARLKELVIENCKNNPDAHLSLMHGDARRETEEFAEQLKAELGIPYIRIDDLPPAILVHAGPGVIAASSFARKSA